MREVGGGGEWRERVKIQGMVGNGATLIDGQSEDVREHGSPTVIGMMAKLLATRRFCRLLTESTPWETAHSHRPLFEF